MSVESVEILSTGIEAITPGDRWPVVIGEEAERFFAQLRPEQCEAVRSEAATILSRCGAPGEVARRAGLVVGYVQSGKTTSFTAVSALAADNGYGLVVIIGGTSTPLLGQTRGRLSKDLRLEDLDAFRRWVHVASPQPGSSGSQRLAAALHEHLDPESDDRVPVLVTIMKQHTHMDHFAAVLEQLAGVDLSRVSTLIVDDEADQATPNLKKGGAESTTYSRLRRIRAALPAHTLLQYTATPQAPLLVSIADEISPEFVCTLRPGNGYTGGRYFFVENHGNFVRHIDRDDLDVIDGDGDDPPRSLQEAFAVFVLGCGVARARGEEDPPQRSMLVHPSQRTLPQARFLSWLRAARDHSVSTLGLPVDDPDRQDHVARIWLPAWEELSQTVSCDEGLEKILEKCVRVLRRISFEEINATSGVKTRVNWGAGAYWVLVGGQLLDRGFTVEGLTVTYMPRGIGVGNADTIQQRARFFGYKASYARYCRAYLDPTVDAAFTNYVRHEDALRSELTAVAKKGGSLKEWKRVFFLDKSLRLTRQGVIRLVLLAPDLRDGWFSQRDFGDPSSDLIQENRETVEAYVLGLDFSPYVDVSGPELAQQHVVAHTTVGEALERLLSNFVMWGDDAGPFTALRVMLEEAGVDAACEIVLMSPNMVDPPRRHRSLRESGKIKNLFQGQNPKSGRIRYVGDRKVRGSDAVTIQIHRVDLTKDDGTDEGGTVVTTDVPVLAVSVPAELQQRVLVQQ